MRKGSVSRRCSNPGCSKEITLNRPWQKYCSDRCRLIAWAIKKVEQDDPGLEDKLREEAANEWRKDEVKERGSKQP